MAPSATRTTTVRMKVARSELTFSTPTLAKIAVRAANKADSSAQASHELARSGMGTSRDEPRTADKRCRLNSKHCADRRPIGHARCREWGLLFAQRRAGPP